MILPIFLIILALLLTSVALWLLCRRYFAAPIPTIKVGILHSLTGTMAKSEIPVMNATLMAIDEINRRGGILGQKIRPIIIDGASIEDTFTQGAYQLIVENQVSVVFGCWTSSSRKAVKPLFETHHHLLFYPIQYEGLESSENIVYTGATPNQQLIPAAQWCLQHLGKKLFLVGSDYIFPRAANHIITRVVSAFEGHIVGEEYIPLGSADVTDVIEKIKLAQPDVILNTINGDTNLFFFRELRQHGITPQIIPTMSFSLGEHSAKSFNLLPAAAGDYACRNYFQSIDNKTNRNFIHAYKKRYGQDEVIEDPMEAGYLGVHLWASAARKAKTTNIPSILHSLKNLELEAPEGRIHVDADKNHLWKSVRIGQIMANGQFKILWTSSGLTKPEAFPSL